MHTLMSRIINTKYQMRGVLMTLHYERLSIVWMRRLDRYRCNIVFLGVESGGIV